MVNVMRPNPWCLEFKVQVIQAIRHHLPHGKSGGKIKNFLAGNGGLRTLDGVRVQYSARYDSVVRAIANYYQEQELLSDERLWNCEDFHTLTREALLRGMQPMPNLELLRRNMFPEGSPELGGASMPYMEQFKGWYHQYCPGYVRYRMQPDRIDSPTTKKILRKKPMLRTADEVTAPLGAVADQGQPDAAGGAVMATPVGSQDPMFSPVGVVRVEAPVRGADQMLDQAARAGVAPGRMAPPMPRQQAGDRAAGGEVFTQQEFEGARAGQGAEQGQGQKHAEWKIEAITQYWGLTRVDAVRLLDGGMPEAKLMQFKRFVQAEEAEQRRIEAQKTERAQQRAAQTQRILQPTTDYNIEYGDRAYPGEGIGQGLRVPGANMLPAGVQSQGQPQPRQGGGMALLQDRGCVPDGRTGDGTTIAGPAIRVHGRTGDGTIIVGPPRGGGENQTRGAKRAREDLVLSPNPEENVDLQRLLAQDESLSLQEAREMRAAAAGQPQPRPKQLTFQEPSRAGPMPEDFPGGPPRWNSELQKVVETLSGVVQKNSAAMAGMLGKTKKRKAWDSDEDEDEDEKVVEHVHGWGFGYKQRDDLAFEHRHFLEDLMMRAERQKKDVADAESRGKTEYSMYATLQIDQAEASKWEAYYANVKVKEAQSPQDKARYQMVQAMAEATERDTRLKYATAMRCHTTHQRNGAPLAAEMFRLITKKDLEARDCVRQVELLERRTVKRLKDKQVGVGVTKEDVAAIVAATQQANVQGGGAPTRVQAQVQEQGQRGPGKAKGGPQWEDGTSLGHPGAQVLKLGKGWHTTLSTLDKPPNPDPEYRGTCAICGENHRAMSCPKMGEVKGLDGVMRVGPRQLYKEGRVTDRYCAK